MTVYVDELIDYGDSVKGEARMYGTLWCHLTCGGDCDELHAFAARIGMRRTWAQHMDRPHHYYHHYDLTPSRRARALKAGAVFKSRMDQAREHNAQRDAEIAAQAP